MQVKGSVRAYGCVGRNASGSAAGAGLTPHPCGVRLAPTLARALAQQGEDWDDVWPVRLFEVRVDAADVVAADDLQVLARAGRVEREVPLDEAFGRRAREVAAFIEHVRGIPWLRPEAVPSSTRIAGLIAEHYAALAQYVAVTPLPACMLRTWRETRDAHETIRAITRPIMAAVGTSTRAADETARSAVKLAGRAAARLAYCGAWEAAWDAAAADVASEAGVRAFRNACADEAMHAALDAAREPARSAAWGIALNLFTDAVRALPPADLAYHEAVAAAQEAYERATGTANGAAPETLRACVVLTAVVAWRLAVVAAFHASWRVAHLVNRVQRADPWGPLVDLWRLGAGPVGTSRRSFLVFVPEASQA